MMAREVVARIRKLLLILCDPLYRGALRYGLGAGTEHQKVIGSCECRMVVDIGAKPPTAHKDEAQSLVVLEALADLA